MTGTFKLEVGWDNVPLFDAAAHGSANDTSLTISHTVADHENRMLIVGVGIRGNVAVTGVTFNGDALTKLDDEHPGSDDRVELWYLIAPDVGTHDAVISLASSQNLTGIVASYYNVHQTTPIASSAAASGTGTTASVAISGGANELVVDVVATQSAGAVPSADASQDERASFAGGAGAAGLSDKRAATTMTWTLSSETWAIIAAALAAPFIGGFEGPNADVTADVLEVQSYRGRDYASQLTGRSSIGTLRATLRNEDGLYSSFNAGGALYGNIKPGRPVRLRSTAPTAATLWTGFLNHIEPRAGYSPMAVLYASGPLVKIAKKKVSPAAQASVDTGTIITAILTAAAWAGASAIETGDVVVNRWFVQDKEAIQAIQEIEEAELGFFYEGADGSLNFESRYHRYLESASVTSQATFSDHAAASLPYIGMEQDDPLREIFNEVEATVQPYSVAAEAVLWTLGETPTLGAGASVTYIAQYPNASSGGASGAYVAAWTTPVAGTDVIASGIASSDIGISVVKTATKMFITITNNHATASATLTTVQAKGTAVSKGNPYLVRQEDTTSQTEFGERTYPLPSPWYPNSAYADAACQLIIDTHKDPHPILTMRLAGNKNSTLFAQAVGRALSDRVTIEADDSPWTQLGISGDFFIEGIGHEVRPGVQLITTFALSPVVSDEAYWQLDVDELGVTTKIGY